MPISDYMRGLRDRIGADLVLMPCAAGLIWNEAGHVLLQRRSDNLNWDVPAGAVDPGESPAQALVREVYEETGLKVVPEAVRCVLGGPQFRITYANGDVTEYTVIVFACRTVGGRLGSLDGESAELHYVSPASIPPLNAPYPLWIFDRSIQAAPFDWDPAWLEAL